MDGAERKEIARGMASAAGRGGVGLTALLLGMVAAALPPAWRGGTQTDLEMDARAAALPSSIAQFIVGLVVYLVGLILWVKGLGDDVSATAAASDDEMRDLLVGHLSLTLSPILPILYVFLSPWGLPSALFLLGGAVRSVHHGVTSEPCADPTLTLVELVRRTIARRVGLARREHAKGPPSPDRLILGDGSEGFHLRLVTREERPWREGTDVRVDGAHWRVTGRRETREGGRLRIVFDFRPLAGAEAMRGSNVYVPSEPPIREDRRRRT